MEKHTLISLNKSYTICIPAIQREYVQGFNEEKSNAVRERFLDDIFAVLESDDSEKTLKLNIIYGYTENNTFYPVDGQQRITTLFIVHWFLWNIAEVDAEPFFKDKPIAYEIRSAAGSFFRELVNPDRISDYKEVLNSNKLLFNSMAQKKWFKSEWFSDVTVLSVINVISELKKRKISKKQAKNYYLKLEEKKITFDLHCMDSASAKRSSIIDYVRLNSRGKELEWIENIKASISTIEKQLKINSTDSFVYKYDKIYSDYFYKLYKSDDKSLEQITKEMNDAILNFMINSYNLMELLLNGKKQADMNSPFKLYTTLSEKCSASNEYKNTFLQSYLAFINNALSTIVHLAENKTGKGFYEQILDIDSKFDDKRKEIANLIYYHEYYIERGALVCKEVDQKFNYVLDNIAYPAWNQQRFRNIYCFSQKVSCFENITEYFQKKSESEIVDDLLLKVCGINVKDIQTKIREQKIKTKFCELNNLPYDYFCELEQKFREKRSIYFLLNFVGLWHDYSDEKCKEVFIELEGYINTARELFKDGATLNLRKLFAVAAYYDIKNERLLSPDEINRNVLYKNDGDHRSFIGNNVHYWDDSFYFIEDTMKETDKRLRELKLSTLKRAYDLYVTQLPQLEKELTTDRYKDCWLRYAYDNNFEALLLQPLMFEHNRVRIKVKLGRDYYRSKEMSINFFAWLYLLKKEGLKEGWSFNQYESPVYDLFTANVRDTLAGQEFIKIKTLENNRIMNVFELKLIWERQLEQQLDRRIFFYIKQTIEVAGDSDTLISLEGNKIIKRIFNYSDYKELVYDLNRDIDSINMNISKENECMTEISSKYDEYRKLKTEHDKSIKDADKYNTQNDVIIKLGKDTDEKLDELNDFVKENYSLVKSYYKNEKIEKYLYRSGLKKEIGTELFKQN